MNLNVINNDNSSSSAKNDLNLYTRRLSKTAKIVIPEIILGDKQIPTTIMLHIFLMSESGHFTIKIRYSEPQLNLGKQFCLFLVEALSAGKMHVCFLSAKETHTPAQTETPDVFFKKPLSRSHTTARTCLTPLLPAQRQPEWTRGLGVWLVLENTAIMRLEDEVLLRDF